MAWLQYFSLNLKKRNYTDLIEIFQLNNLFYLDYCLKPFPEHVYFSVGFDTEGLGPTIFRGGETEALARLERHLERKVS